MLRTMIIGCMIGWCAISAQSVDALVDEAVTLYETRHHDPGNLSEAHDILEKALTQDAEHVRALYEMSHVYFLLGDRAETKDEKLELYKQGQEYGKQAKKLDDDCAEAHFWYMVNMGRVGQTQGVLNSLSLVPDIKKEIDKVLKIDPRHTGALDAKAMLYYELPGVLGGSLNRSMEALNEAIAIDSNYTLLYVDMAKVYIKKKDHEQARWYLNRALQITEPTHEADHTLDDRPEAELLLEEIKDK